jgi:lysophospholipase L1-like esterase
MLRSSPRLRRALGLLALVVASASVSLLAMEVMVRILGGRSAPPPGPEAETAVPPDPALEGLPVITSVKELRRPNTRGVNAGVLYRSNSLGIRGPDYPREPPPGVFRITVSGDSVTMGHGVREEDAYPAVLERLLNADSDERRFEVINLGISGLNIIHSLGRLELRGRFYNPDLVVYGFTLNDIEGAGYVRTTEEATQRYAALLYRHSNSRSRLLGLLWPRLVILAGSIRPLEGSYSKALDHNYFHNQKTRSRLAEGLDRLAAVGRIDGVCAHVFVHTRLEQLVFLHPYRRFYRLIEEKATARGLTVTESYPKLRWHLAESLRRTATDSHPNVEGHRLFGEALYDGLRRLPPRCWEKRPRNRESRESGASPRRGGTQRSAGVPYWAGETRSEAPVERSARSSRKGSIGASHRRLSSRLSSSRHQAKRL